MQHYFDKVQDISGNAIPGAIVSVYNSVGSLATIYSGNGVTPIGNPITTGLTGQYAFYAANGTYTIVVAAPNFTGQTSAGIVLYDPADLGVGIPFYPGSGGADDALALQTYAHFNQGRRIVVQGTALNFYTTCIITDSGGTVIDLNGATVTQHTNNIDSFVFQPTTAGTTAAFLNYGGLVNGFVAHNLVAATSTSGNGVKLVQCNGVIISNVVFTDADVVQAGGQLNRFDNCSFFASHGSTRGAGTALVHFQDAIYAGSSYQKPFTSVVQNWKASATKLRDAIFRIHSGDGIHIGEGYGGFGNNCIVLLLSDHTNTTIGSCTIEGAYLDCVNTVSGTPNVIEIRDDSDATSWVYGLLIANNWMGNGSGVGVLCRKVNVQALSIIGNTVVNMTSWAADLQGGAATNYLVVGNQSQNNFGWRFAGNGGTLAFNSNSFTNTTGPVCLSVAAGNWTAATVNGNMNANSAVADYALSGSAIFSAGAPTIDGNASAYPGTTPTQSWRKTIVPLDTYANNAAAVAAGLTTGMQYRVGNIVQVV